MNLLNKVLHDLQAIYILAVIFTGLSFVTSCIGAVFLDDSRRVIAGLKVSFSLFAVVMLVVIGIVIYTALYNAIEEVNTVGREEMRVSCGQLFLALTWTSSVLMSLVNIFNVREFIAVLES